MLSVVVDGEVYCEGPINHPEGKMSYYTEEDGTEVTILSGRAAATAVMKNLLTNLAEDYAPCTDEDYMERMRKSTSHHPFPIHNMAVIP